MEGTHFIDILIINVTNNYMVNSVNKLNKSFGGYFHLLFVFPQMTSMICLSHDIVRSSIRDLDCQHQDEQLMPHHHYFWVMTIIHYNCDRGVVRHSLHHC